MCDPISPECLLKPREVVLLRPDLLLMTQPLPPNKSAQVAVQQWEKRQMKRPPRAEVMAAVKERREKAVKVVKKRKRRKKPADRKQYFKAYYIAHRADKIERAKAYYRNNYAANI